MTDSSDRKSVRPRASVPPTRGALDTSPNAIFPNSDPPSGALASDDFLYHLYRGSELLQDNQVELAKDELERALLLQPRDVEGQGLLGVVYFRLGLYPRAIDIYDRICRVAPAEVAPKINLGLCYLKTGQLALAHQALEEALALEPEHKRAWAYLGLIFQRQGEFGKACTSFERAEQSTMADRMRLLEEQEHAEGAALLRDDHPHELRNAAEGAFEELEYGKDPFAVAQSTEHATSSGTSGRWRAIELGEETLPQPARLPRTAMAALPDAELAIEQPDTERADLPVSAVPLEQFVHTRSLGSLTGRQATLLDASTVHISLVRPFAVRAGRVRSVTLRSDAWNESRLMRRSGARGFDEPLGGASDPIVCVATQGELVARSPGHVLTLMQLNDDCMTLREENILGFDCRLRYDWTRFEIPGADALSLLEFSGTGLLILRWSSPPRSLGIAERCTLVHAQDVAGWTGRVVPNAVDPAESPGKLRGFLGFTGQGTVLTF